LDKFDGDKKWDAQSWEFLFKNAGFSTSNPNVCLVVFFNYTDMGLVLEKLEDSSDWGTPHFCFWVKPNASNTGGLRYVSAVETFFVCYKSSCTNQYWNFGTAPADRLNFIEMDSVSKGERVLTHNGKAFQCQKPVALLVSIFKHHCVAGSTILDLGAGSGSAEIAALAAGCNVVGLEIHNKTFALAKKRVLTSFDFFEKSNFYFDDGDNYQSVNEEIEGSPQNPDLGSIEDRDDELETEDDEETIASQQTPTPLCVCCVCTQTMENSADFGSCMVCTQPMHKSCTTAPQLGGDASRNILCSINCGEE